MTRNNLALIYGVYGLTRKYCHADQVDRLLPRIVPEITIDIPQPQIDTVQVVVTSRCNLDCLYCSFKANAPAYMSKDMNEQELSSICDFINHQDREISVLITGGEPELNPQAIDYLLQKAPGRRLLFTNGTLTNSLRLKKYAENDVVVLFSLDGEEEINLNMRKGKAGTFRKIENSLALAAKIGLHFGISTVVNDHNLDTLAETVKFLHQKYHPHSIGLNLPHKYGEFIWKRSAEYVNALKQVYLYAKANALFIDQINRRLKHLVERRFRLRDCAAQGRKVVFFPGGVNTCCVNEAGLGPVNVDWINTIPLLSDECKDCYALGICGGGCLYDGASIYGAGKFDQRNCLFTKQMLEFFLWDFFDTLGFKAEDDQLVKDTYQPLLSIGNGSKISFGHDLE